MFRWSRRALAQHTQKNIQWIRALLSRVFNCAQNPSPENVKGVLLPAMQGYKPPLVRGIKAQLECKIPPF